MQAGVWEDEGSVNGTRTFYNVCFEDDKEAMKRSKRFFLKSLCQSPCIINHPLPRSCARKRPVA
jgi:hypothetical protein